MSEMNVKKVSLLTIVFSWFIYTGIGINVLGTPIDISKMVILCVIFIFIILKLRFKIHIIDKIFLLYILMQILFSVFFIDFFHQSIYLAYYVVFYYSSYFIARSIFDNNNLFEYFIKYLTYITIIMLLFMIILNMNNIYFLDNFRVAYSEEVLNYSHKYIKIFHGINFGKSFVGQFLSPNTSSQFIGMLMVLLVPYYLWKLNHDNLFVFIILFTVLIIGLAMTQSRIAVIIILMQFFILLILRYRYSMKTTIAFCISLFIVALLNYDVILFYYYLLTALSTYVDQVSIVSSVSSVSSDRVYFYILFFKYIFTDNINFLFGYGPLVDKFIPSVIGITDLAWIFNTFLQVGLFSIFVYMFFYFKILQNIWNNYKIDNVAYIGLLKYVLAVFIGLLVVSIPTYQAILNPIYFFIIGAIVSLVLNETNYKSSLLEKDE